MLQWARIATKTNLSSPKLGQPHGTQLCTFTGHWTPLLIVHKSDIF